MGSLRLYVLVSYVSQPRQPRVPMLVSQIGMVCVVHAPTLVAYFLLDPKFL